MPRRKQDCPKRMKWEEGGGECPKDGAEYPPLGEGESGGAGGSDGSSEGGEGRRSKGREGEGGGEEEEGSGSSSEGEEQAGPEAHRTVAAQDSRPVTVSLDSTVDKDLISSDLMSAREEDKVIAHAPPTEAQTVNASSEVATAATYHHRPLTPPLGPLPVAMTTTGGASPTDYTPYHSPMAAPEEQYAPPHSQHHHHRHSLAPPLPPPPPPEEEMASSDTEDAQDGPLDFSVRKKQPTPLPAKLSNLAAPPEPALPAGEDAPLDLSVSSRKRPRSEAIEGHVGIMQHVNAHLGHMVTHRNKSLRLDTNAGGAASGATKPSSPWSNQFPFRFSPSSSPNSGVEIPMWNGGGGGAKGGGGSRSTPSPSTGNHYSNNEQTPQQQRRDSSPVGTHHHAHHASSQQHKSASGASSGGGGGRHNAWQSHWLSRGAEQAKDVLKCVWCRKSFRSLEEMTSHMKEARHCGMHVPHQTSLPPPLPPPPPPPHSLSTSGSKGGGKKANGDEQSAQQQQQQQMMKEQTTALPMPRKLVRGQDVWLGKGAEQTKQILKCMWCGQSFKTLAEMTTHMQQTQHYTNIISQEQIISWKSPEDKMAASGQAHVNAVLTCKVCDQAFSSLKELSNHMVKNSHYKEHILRSITENGGRRRQSREKRKKSLPVRKLLELERAQNEMNRTHDSDGGGTPTHTPAHHHHHHSSASAQQQQQQQPPRDQPRKSASGSDGNGRITCEKCARKIDTRAFVDHIRLCVGNAVSEHGRPPPPPTSSSSISSLSTLIASVSPKHDKRSCSPRKPEVSSSPSPRHHSSSSKHSYSSPILQPSPTSSSESNGQLLSDLNSAASGGGRGNGSEAPSVLNAIERLIEKSFDGKQSRGRYVTASSGSNRTTPSTPQLPAPMDMVMMKGEELGPHHLHHHRGSESEEEADEEEDDVGGAVIGYQKLVIDEEGGVASRKSRAEVEEEEALEEQRKNRRRKMRVSGGSRLTSPHEEQQQHHAHQQRNVRASPSSTGSKRDAASPARSSESPGSCSNCSSHGTVVSAHTGSGLTGSGLSLVRSSPSPSSPTSGADHPLKELQKLLDKTNVSLSKSASASVSVIRDALSPPTHPPHSGTPQATSPLSTSSYAAGWSAEPAGSGDVIHCNFCDNSFVSKTAFRHHVTKVHAKLMTSAASPLNVPGRSPSASSSSSTSSSASSSANSPNVNLTHNNNNNNTNNANALCKSPAKNNNNNAVATSSAGAALTSSSSSMATSAPPDDSPHSKFLKYTELAKQLSSKYV